MSTKTQCDICGELIPYVSGLTNRIMLQAEITLDCKDYDIISMDACEGCLGDLKLWNRPTKLAFTKALLDIIKAGANTPTPQDMPGWCPEHHILKEVDEHGTYCRQCRREATKKEFADALLQVVQDGADQPYEPLHGDDGTSVCGASE